MGNPQACPQEGLQQEALLPPPPAPMLGTGGGGAGCPAAVAKQGSLTQKEGAGSRAGGPSQPGGQLQAGAGAGTQLQHAQALLPMRCRSQGSEFRGLWGPRAPRGVNHLLGGRIDSQGIPGPPQPPLPTATLRLARPGRQGLCCPPPLVGPKSPSPGAALPSARGREHPTLCVFTFLSSGSYPLRPDFVQYMLPRTRARISTSANTWGAGVPILEIEWRRRGPVVPQAWADLLLAFAQPLRTTPEFPKEAWSPTCLAVKGTHPDSKSAAPQRSLALGQ